MKETVEYIIDLEFPGIGTIKYAGEKTYTKKSPEIYFLIAGHKIDFMLFNEEDGGIFQDDTLDEKKYTRRLIYKPYVSMNLDEK